jgi:glyoxylase-like metal-dependent hydrolase (beta-lactamase superfamily II)
VRTAFSICILSVLAAQLAIAAENITPTVSVIPGPVNGVLITKSGKTLAIYGDPRTKPALVDKILFTHHRRDVVWAGRAMVAAGAEPVYPSAEEPLFTAPEQYWAKYSQFHDYANQSTRVLLASIAAGHAVSGGDRVDWNGLTIEVRDTPGYTRGAVSYLFVADGKRIACVGDLIYGDGQILDLFSLQDSIAETKEDGYHGYAARAGQVIASLRQIADWKPDVLIPARGPVIRNPQQTIAKLIARLQDVFSSYFAVSALHWYRGDDKLHAQARRILGDRPVDWMPMSKAADPPSWLEVIGNTRVIVSASGNAFVVDCGNRRLLDTIKQMQREGRFKTVEGIWVTHYHDDHTNFVQTASEELHAPVFSSPEMQDILEHPAAYKMPCLTANPIHDVTAAPEGGSQRWHEFEFTYSNFPGQTLFHDGLLVKKDGGESVFFIGDSFTPSGIDDYCLLNRNFAEPEQGYEYCLNYVKRVKPDWLVNQHVNPAFHFSDPQIDTMLANLRRRRTQLAALFPWDDANFGIDEQWARVYPYRSEAKPGARVDLKVIVLNHSPKIHEFVVTPHVPEGWHVGGGPFKVMVGSRKTGEVTIPVTAGAQGLAVITADVAFDKFELREWLEALLDVK